MIIYILKFSACLAIFLAFYKLFLERENMHQFKRFYLLGSILTSIAIPFITFTTYIEPQPIVDGFNEIVPLSSELVSATTENPTNYVPIIIWSIYGVGVLLFGIKFAFNLAQMILKIKRNPKLKNSSFINVLLQDLVSPHTFFSYIFLNKHKYETHQIPEEVLLHEQTHAKQKHSIDILLIETLQVIFWFNPLIHVIKNSIKLNHEFLADKAVLNKGVETSSYQQILLTFSTNDKDIQLANAINYSSIKKRITVMKTQTSKQKIWLRSFVLLPLLALTLYSFSDRIESIKETTINSIKPESTKNILIFIRKNRELVVNDKVVQYETLSDRLENLNKSLTYDERKKEVSAYVIVELNTDLNYVKKIKETIENYGVSNLKVEEGKLPESLKSFSKGAGYPVLELSINPIKLKLNGKPTSINSFKDDFNLVTDGKQKNIWIESDDEISVQILQNLIQKLGEKDIVFNIDSSIKLIDEKLKPQKTNKKQDGASREQMKEYEKLAKHYNSLPKDQLIIKKEDLERMKYIYHLMSDKQKKDTEPFPVLPPPPPPPPPAPIANEAKKVLPPPPPPPIPDNATEEQKEKYRKVVEEYNRKYTVKNGRVSENPPPPPPPPPIPDNATPEQRKKYEEATRIYNLRVEKMAYQEAKTAKIKTEKGELTRVRVLNKEEVAKLKKEKEAYKNRQKLELTQVREAKSADVEKLKKEKLAYAEAHRAKLSTDERLARLREIEPPKPPRSPLDHVIDMAKKDAKFYLEGKEISSDEAIEALKENKHLNIQTLDSSSKQPKVYITKKPIVIDN